MNLPIERPAALRVNAWDGAATPVQDLPAATPWALTSKASRAAQWLAPPETDPRNWRDPDVGWGLVLPDNDTLDDAAKARGEDAPDPLKKLLADRGGPVLRYRPELRVGHLRRHYPDQPPHDLSVQAPNPGTAPGRVPQYLLIYAPPDVIPWRVQYALNMSCCVGRLDLEGDALANYVDALLHGFGAADARAPLVWSVDFGKPDITWLMARVVADKLADAFAKDADLTGRARIGEADATAAKLLAALHDRKPGLVITSSHGQTGPLADPTALKSRLGGMVDIDHGVIDVSALAGWAPEGAIWYAHACCSAGSDQQTRYAGLLPADGAVGALLAGIASAAGAMIAPLPRALLGAPKPLRAFVGHVEPTFDWTLRAPQTGQVLTHTLVNALWNQLYRPGPRTPVGLALARIYQEAGSFLSAWQTAKENVDAAVPQAKDWALYYQLVALDRQTLVILGDPTVTLAPF